MTRFLLLTATVCMLVGCATDPSAKMAKHQIKTIGVDARVDAPAMRFGKQTHSGNLTVALTELTVDAIKANGIKRMAGIMQEHKIDVAGMVSSNFVQAITDLGYQFSTNQPDATFVVEFEQVGFDEAGFSSRKVPFAVLLGKLVKTDGEVIWRGNSDNGNEALFGEAGASGAATKSNGEKIGVPKWEDYEQNPEKLRADWDAVTLKAVHELLRAAKKSQ
jgi:hypothetical protein